MSNWRQVSWRSVTLWLWANWFRSLIYFSTKRSIFSWYYDSGNRYYGWHNHVYDSANHCNGLLIIDWDNDYFPWGKPLHIKQLLHFYFFISVSTNITKITQKNDSINNISPKRIAELAEHSSPSSSDRWSSWPSLFATLREMLAELPRTLRDVWKFLDNPCTDGCTSPVNGYVPTRWHRDDNPCLPSYCKQTNKLVNNRGPMTDQLWMRLDHCVHCPIKIDSYHKMTFSKYSNSPVIWKNFENKLNNSHSALAFYTNVETFLSIVRGIQLY